MNSLSWVLYLADAVGRVSWITLSTIAPVIVLYVLHQVLASIDYADEKNRNDTSGDAKYYNSLQRNKKYYITSIVLLALVYTITPSKKTIYLIAGSEAGEYVVTSPEGQEIINDIKSIIKSQIEELK